MHPAKLFQMQTKSEVLECLRAYPFCTITSADGHRPVCAHAPVCVDDDESVLFHLARSNAAVSVIERSKHALVSTIGPDAYISPDWYGIDDQVPTWNYLALEIEGDVETLDRTQTIALMDKLSATFEADLNNKTPWTRHKMMNSVFDKMLNAIVGFKLRPTRMEGTRKLNQNKSAEVQTRVINALREIDPNDAIARLMEHEQKGNMALD